MTGGQQTERDAERGETLIEILITMIVMGIAVVALLAGLAATVRLGTHNSQVTHVRNSAQTYAEMLKAPVGALVYEPCGTYGTLDQSFLPNASYSARIKSVEYVTIVPDGNIRDAATWGSACSVDKGLQRLVIEVKVTSGGMSSIETVAIIKRDARCTSSTYQSIDQGPC